MTNRCVDSESDCSCDEMSKPRSTLCSDFKCKKGTWFEKKKPCPSECSVFGAQHVVTFDKKNFNFNSNCEVILSTNRCGNDAPREDFFKITVKNELCENAPDLVCTKKLVITFGRNEDSYTIQGMGIKKYS